MKLAVLDIETTGLEYFMDIVEIGIVVLDLETGIKVPILNQIVNEGRFLNPNAWIFQNTDLTPDMVKDSDYTLNDLRVDCAKIDIPIVAYNMPFDFGFLHQRQIYFHYYAADPMIIATNYYKIYHPKHGYKYPSVPECFTRLQINRIEKHRACDDAEGEAEIVYQLYQKGIYKPNVVESSSNMLSSLRYFRHMVERDIYRKILLENPTLSLDIINQFELNIKKCNMQIPDRMLDVEKQRNTENGDIP